MNQLPTCNIKLFSQIITEIELNNESKKNSMSTVNKNNANGGSTSAPSSLGYRVVSCTSEDPQHPISSIQLSSIRSTGYQSAPNPHYPIEFILDLGSVAEIDTIQFVSHQYKIASRLDLYVALEDQTFRALGSFQFSDNSFTDFKARELKSATLNGIRAQYIKISIPGCHTNGANSSNQIGLISLNIIGRGGSISQLNKTLGPGQLGGNDLGSTMSAPNDLLEQLERQKKEAVAKEEFKKAESLKQQIDRLRRAYSQIAQLQQQKNDAIAHEDYATAQRLKNEIDFLLKGEVSQPQQPLQQQPKKKQPQPQQQQQTFQTSQKQEFPIDDQVPSTQTTQPKKQNQQKQTQNGGKKLPLRQVDINDPNANLEDAIPTQQRRDESHYASDERPIHPAPNAFDDDTNFDEQSPPAASASKAKKAKPKFKTDERPIHPSKDIDFDENPSPKNQKPRKGPSVQPSGKDLATDPEELSHQDASEAGLLIELFGERPVACFFSHAWNLRKSGIQELGQLITGLKDRQKDAFSRYCYIMRHRVQETHKTVFQAAIDNLMKTADELNLSTQDLGDCINQMITQLIPKVGCSQSALSDTACSFLMWLCSKGLYDIVIPIVMKPLKNPNQYLVAVAQLNTLYDIIVDNFGVEKIPGLTFKGVMEFIVPFLEHPNPKVRGKAINLIVAMHNIYGTKINQYYDKVNKNTKLEIERAIEAFYKSLNSK